LLAVLVISLPLSWFAVRMNKARKQRAAVEAIEAMRSEQVSVGSLQEWHEMGRDRP